MCYCASVMQIKVVDHIIIGDNTYFSFANEWSIEAYELNFMGLKIRNTGETKLGRNRAGSDSLSC